jgi:hypothetical protein
VDIYGETNPDLTENDTWTEDHWKTALQQDFQTLAYQGHGTYNAWLGTEIWSSLGWGVYTNEIDQWKIGENNPLIVAHACNLAMPSDEDGASWNPSPNDNMTYKMVDHGIVGLVGSTGIATTNTITESISYGEQLVNDYFKYLIPDKDVIEFTNQFGKAFLETKNEYDPNGWFFGLNWDLTDKKTMLEYVYYGIPWAYKAISNTQTTSSIFSEKPFSGFLITSSSPKASNIAYSKTITATISSYQFTPLGSFELLEIPGADYSYSYQQPIWPYLIEKINIPRGGSVSSLQLINEQSTSLGAHNIPAADPSTQYHPTDGYTSTMNIVGTFPNPRYSYEVRDFPDHSEIWLRIAPSTFNVDTQEVVLFDQTVLQVNYTTTETIVAYDFELDPLFSPGEQIVGQATVENVGTSTKTLTSTLFISDNTETFTDTVVLEPFTIDPGEILNIPITYTHSITNGVYNIFLNLLDETSVQASTDNSFSILSGEFGTLSVPDRVRINATETISTTFYSYQQTAQEGYADGYVYDKYGTIVEILTRQSILFPAQNETLISWTWDIVGYPSGGYRVNVVVSFDDLAYLSPKENVIVMADTIHFPFTVK